MSRVVLIDKCYDCPKRESTWREDDTYGNWCGLARKSISVLGALSVPEWCPLPENKEESDAKG